MFTNVLKKFFTDWRTFENNTSTNAARPLPDPVEEGPVEMTELKETLSRNAATIAQDFAGVAALVVIFLTGLSLPGLL